MFIFCYESIEITARIPNSSRICANPNISVHISYVTVPHTKTKTMVTEA